MLVRTVGGRVCVVVGCLGCWWLGGVVWVGSGSGFGWGWFCGAFLGVGFASIFLLAFGASSPATRLFGVRLDPRQKKGRKTINKLSVFACFHMYRHLSERIFFSLDIDIKNIII